MVSRFEGDQIKGGEQIEIRSHCYIMPPYPDITDNITPRREPTLFLMGGYTCKDVLAHSPEGAEGDGFYSVIFDPENGQFKRLISSEVKTNPAFIMKHPTLDIVYMTTEVITRQ